MLNREKPTVWIRLSFAPLWVRIAAFIALAALSAGLFIAASWYQDGTFPNSLIAMLVIGVGGAAVWSAVAVSQAKQRYGRVLADIDLPSTRAAALRAAVSGPIPTDPAVRRIAAVLATIRAQSIAQHARRQIISGAWGSAIMAALAMGALATVVHGGRCSPAFWPCGSAPPRHTRTGPAGAPPSGKCSSRRELSRSDASAASTATANPTTLIPTGTPHSAQHTHT
jgi:hypothetical protein